MISKHIVLKAQDMF